MEPMQSAYRKHHSTETTLLAVQNDLLMAIDQKKAAVVVLLDLSAAFDTIGPFILPFPKNIDVPHGHKLHGGLFKTYQIAGVKSKTNEIIPSRNWKFSEKTGGFVSLSPWLTSPALIKRSDYAQIAGRSYMVSLITILTRTSIVQHRKSTYSL